ncbi:MAG TPA: uracil-DNA glycosylase family protein [Anaerolineae bacterium]|jgi:hypothetical protein
MLAIQNFQQRLYTRYKNTLSLPATYNYLYGNPVQPVVPIQTSRRGVCIIAVSPPARLATVGPELDVPVADGCYPFAPAAYFDGSRVRPATGLDLDDAYLAPLGLRREQCWLTYLVRVFLFKDEHLARYRRLGCPWPERETYSQFEALARESLPWLEEELALARPRLVITLGTEVAEVLQAVPGLAVNESLLGGVLKDVWLGEAVYPALHLGAPVADKSDLTKAREIVRRIVG